MNCVCISKHLNEVEIKNVFSRILETNCDCIGVFTEESELLHSEDCLLRIVITELPGEFPQWFDIYPETGQTDLEIASRLIDEIQVQVLITDSTVNPYRWKLCVENEQSVVNVDQEFLDLNEGFKIEGNRR